MYSIDQETDEYHIITPTLLKPLILEIIAMGSEEGMGIDEACFRLRNDSRYSCVGREAVRECMLFPFVLYLRRAVADGSEHCTRCWWGDLSDV